MIRSSLQLAAIFAALVSLAGCDSEGRTRPPATTVRVLNAAPGYESLEFLREERTEAGLAFGVGQDFRFDSDTYEFSVSVNLPESGPSRLRTISREVNDSNEYFIVVTEAAGTADMVFVARPLGGSDTGLVIVHGAENQAAFDVYFAAAGTDPATIAPVASLSFGGSQIVDSLSAGDFELVLTPAGDPATVSFRSGAVTLGAGSYALVAIANEKNRGTLPFSVFWSQGAAQRLADPTQGSAVVRVINGASDMLARDVYLDGDFTAPLIAGAAFASVTGYVPIANGTRALAVTPAGNPSVTEATNSPIIVQGFRYSTIIGGNPTPGLVATTVLEDHRSFNGVGRVQFVNTAHNFTLLDFYVAAPGTDIATIAPLLGLGPDGANAVGSILPGTHELTIRDRVNSTVVAGPMPLPIVDGSVNLLLVTDAVGGSTVDVQVLDDTGQ